MNTEAHARHIRQSSRARQDRNTRIIAIALGLLAVGATLGGIVFFTLHTAIGMASSLLAG